MAARARIDRRLDDDIFAGQMFGKAADVTPRGLRRGRLILPFRLPAWPPAPVRQRRREILEPERHLPWRPRIELLRARSVNGPASASPASPATCRSRRCSSAIIPIRMSGLARQGSNVGCHATEFTEAFRRFARVSMRTTRIIACAASGAGIAARIPICVQSIPVEQQP